MDVEILPQLTIVKNCGKFPAGTLLMTSIFNALKALFNWDRAYKI